jgi:hypothetical protein
VVALGGSVTSGAGCWGPPACVPTTGINTGHGIYPDTWTRQYERPWARPSRVDGTDALGALYFMAGCVCACHVVHRALRPRLSRSPGPGRKLGVSLSTLIRYTRKRLCLCLLAYRVKCYPMTCQASSREFDVQRYPAGLALPRAAVHERAESHMAARGAPAVQLRQARLRARVLHQLPAGPPASRRRPW